MQSFDEYVSREGGRSRPPTFAQKYIPTQGCQPLEVYQAQARHNAALGIPAVQRVEPHGRKLAIAGGGFSTRDHLEFLRKFDGDVWALSSTCPMLNLAGVYATLFCVDPEACVADIEAPAGIFSYCVHPLVFERMRGKPVQAFYTQFTAPEGYQGLVIHGGVSSVCFTPLTALWMGYRDVTYIGCEGSFPDPDKGGTTHHDHHDGEDEVLAIRCGGQTYWTKRELLHQCEKMAEVIRMFPHLYREMSGGLLRAFIETDTTYDVIGASEKLFPIYFPEHCNA